MNHNLIIVLGLVVSTSAANAGYKMKTTAVWGGKATTEWVWVSDFKIKATPANTDGVMSALKKGSAQRSSMVSMKHYGFQGRESQAMLLSTVARPGKEATHVLVSRTPGKSLDILEITLVRPLDKSIKNKIDKLPPTNRMHENIGDEGKKALAESGLKEEGLSLMEELSGTGQVRLQTTALAETRDQMDTLMSQGANVSLPREVLMDQTIAFRRNGQIENQDLRYIESFDGTDTAAATFTIRLGIHKETSEAALRRAIEVAQNGGKVSAPVRQTTQAPASGLDMNYDVIGDLEGTGTVK